MKKGNEILNSTIGKKLVTGKIQSFYLNGKLEDRIISTFLKFDNWIRIVSTDEITTVEIIQNPNNELYEFDGFEYPIENITNHFPEFEKYVDKKLLSWKELIFKNDKEMSFGVKLNFEENETLIIHNQDYPIDRNEYIFGNEVPKDLNEI